ncbi:MAG: Antidote-toxin recognition MazE, bacterial antitoxin [Hyphomicrobiales bacterium]|jgi:AbrB family looped-hinge helix DNA binding protein|nr:Antidote-toxin recognition MazE, bacterial antitoxin [Hyphomicrobiales bacterium]
MALMRVRRAAQLTLPAEVRQALNVKEGDYLDAQIVKDGVLLRPVSMANRDAESHRAWQEIQEIMSRVKDLEPTPNEDPSAREEWIAEIVKEFRREKRGDA